MDWLNRFDCLPAGDAQTALRHPQLAYEALLLAVHCVASSGRVWRGADALRFIAGRVPLLLPVWLLLHLPGVLRFTAWLYRVVARNRYCLGGQRMTGCRIQAGGPPEADGRGRSAARKEVCAG